MDIKEAITTFECKDGVLYWKSNGKKAGWTDENGYQRVQFNNKAYRAHRIIFLMHHGYMPDFIDHIDKNPANNEIENLRAADKSLNRKNCKVNKNSISGIRGVHWNKKVQKYQVMFKVKNKYKSFGYYFDVDYAKFIAETMFHKYGFERV
jgi:hypothetical protein